MKRTAPRPQTIADIPRKWDELVAMHALRPIHDKVGLQNATEVLDVMAGHKLTRDQEDYFEALTILVTAYEDEHDPVEVDGVRGVAALKALLDNHDMAASDLGRLLGLHRSHASKLLNGERSLTIEHIRRLAEHFSVGAEIFLS